MKTVDELRTITPEERIKSYGENVSVWGLWKSLDPEEDVFIHVELDNGENLPIVFTTEYEANKFMEQFPNEFIGVTPIKITTKVADFKVVENDGTIAYFPYGDSNEIMRCYDRKEYYENISDSFYISGCKLEIVEEKDKDRVMLRTMELEYDNHKFKLEMKLTARSYGICRYFLSQIVDAIKQGVDIFDGKFKVLDLKPVSVRDRVLNLNSKRGILIKEIKMVDEELEKEGN